MIKCVDFTEEYIEQAKQLAWENYLEECEHVTILPKDVEIPDLMYFADNRLGVAALEEGKLVGFLGVCHPWEGAFDSFDSLGTFSPTHAHGAVKVNRSKIYQDMYEYGSKKWVEQKIVGVGISLYAHDEEAKYGLFEYGFGMRCKDRIMLTANNKDDSKAEDLKFYELELKDFPVLHEMRRELDNHLRNAPCFMAGTNDEFEQWVAKVEAGDRRTFVAEKKGEIIAFIDIRDDAENFIAEHPLMKSIHGAYCKPECRGKGVYGKLLDYLLGVMRAEGNIYLGVDHESYNPTANRFWSKYFEEYTNSVVRKIEIWSVGK